MRKQKGFSLIELLIVVATILIIAAVAIPNLVRTPKKVAVVEGIVRTLEGNVAVFECAGGVIQRIEFKSPPPLWVGAKFRVIYGNSNDDYYTHSIVSVTREE